jgi:hypothetical protein
MTDIDFIGMKLGEEIWSNGRRIIPSPWIWQCSEGISPSTFNPTYPLRVVIKMIQSKRKI